MASQHLLGLIGVDEAQIRLGDLARPLAIDVPIHNGNERLSANAHRWINDFQLALRLRNLEVRLVFPGEMNVAKLLAGEGDGRAARPRVELGDVAIQLRHKLACVILGSAPAYHRAPRGEEAQLAVA